MRISIWLFIIIIANVPTSITFLNIFACLGIVLFQAGFKIEIAIYVTKINNKIKIILKTSTYNINIWIPIP